MRFQVFATLLAVALVGATANAALADASDRPASATSGNTFRDCEACPEMVIIPSGAFMMGATAADQQQSLEEFLKTVPEDRKAEAMAVALERLSHEGPLREVRLDQPFAMGRYEVTFAEWNACVQAGGCTRQPDDEGFGRDRHPVMNVSWLDAQEYVTWLSQVTGHSYRLPSESEWEYAARAGTTTRFWWGDNASRAHANYGMTERSGPHAGGPDVWKYTAPVGSFPANAFGLHDMLGNVFEWVRDCANAGYAGVPTDGSAWTTERCESRVIRGGSWFSTPRNLRSAYRVWYPPEDRYSVLGLRVARSLP